MADLQGFVDEVIALIRAVDGIDFVPDEPQLMPTILPMSTVYASSGRGRHAPAGAMTYWHDVRIAFVGPLDNLEQVNDLITGKLEAIVEAVYDNLGSYTNAVNIGDFDYTFGPIQWGGMDVYGLMLDFREVKIQRNL